MVIKKDVLIWSWFEKKKQQWVKFREIKALCYEGKYFHQLENWDKVTEDDREIFDEFSQKCGLNWLLNYGSEGWVFTWLNGWLALELRHMIRVGWKSWKIMKHQYHFHHETKWKLWQKLQFHEKNRNLLWM